MFKKQRSISQKLINVFCVIIIAMFSWVALFISMADTLK